MEKIVTHPLYIRCKKVIDSCETPEQREVAIKYIDLAAPKIVKDYLKGVKWN